MLRVDGVFSVIVVWGKAPAIQFSVLFIVILVCSNYCWSDAWTGNYQKSDSYIYCEVLAQGEWNPNLLPCSHSWFLTVAQHSTVVNGWSQYYESIYSSTKLYFLNIWVLNMKTAPGAFGTLSCLLECWCGYHLGVIPAPLFHLTQQYGPAASLGILAAW